MTAQYDLTQKLLTHLDPHLCFPLLSHLSHIDLFDTHDLAKAQYELAKHTNMIDYTLQFHKQAYPDEAEPKDVLERRKQLQEKSATLEQQAEKVLSVIEDPNVAQALKQDKARNLEWLQQNYSLTKEQIDALFHYGYFHFSCGNYKEASSYLYHYGVLAPENRYTASMLWGKLACNVLTGDWDRALEDVRQLREHIDAQRATTSAVAGSQNEVTHEDILQKRTWLLHWSLFVWFNHPSGRTKLVELFMSPAYLATVQMSCWWLLRYIIVALVITRRQVSRGYVVETSGNPTGQQTSSNPTNKLSTHAALRELNKVIQLESYRLDADPFVDFFRNLYLELDFDQAQEQLIKAEKVAKEDFFLQDHVSEFVENARCMITEAYCRIYKDVSIADLAKHLNLSEEQGKEWITKLANDGKTDMKMEIKDDTLHFNQSRPVLYQSVIDKTRGITLRTSAVFQALDRHSQANHTNFDSNQAEGDASHDESSAPMEQSTPLTEESVADA
ncbi:eukaryotic translation initiation factor 3 subunit E [Malassezia yamatoensis]|uniref:Eukaryotic translation initiation factor 3 subunit E n=1 Tax=Malassezia yamatoensis TaxID=253288 RepID=A0AAJ5YV18_9BASI|nr:eukaryotic translation initiation factor 3 subunit E [Malassezia yamatoensis]